MALPDNKLFNHFLSNSKLVDVKPDNFYVPFVGSKTSFGPNEPSFSLQTKALFLSYPASDLKIESVIKRLKIELNEVGHCVDDAIAISVLGLIVESFPTSTNLTPVQHANNCLSNLIPAQLFQFVISTYPRPHDNVIELGDFTLKPFDPQKILYWASRGKSNWPINLRELKHFSTLERKPLQIKILNLNDFQNISSVFSKWGEEIFITKILDVYYQAINQFFLKQIRSNIKDYLLVYESGALVSWSSEEDSLQNLFQKTISLFLWEKKNETWGTWALLSEKNAIHTNDWPADLMPKCKKWLLEELGFTKLSLEKPFDKVIAIYSKFLNRALDHFYFGRDDESFLHFVIALDLLFGLEGKSTDSICNRVAVLTYQQMSVSFEEQVRKIKRLYDCRSKYVHEGKQIQVENLEDINKICREVLWDLLATSSTSKFEDIDLWLRQIDFVASAIKASKEVMESEFINIGIPPKGRPRIPPNTVKRDWELREIQDIRLPVLLSVR